MVKTRRNARAQPLRLMVASTIYGFQTEIEQVCAVLRAYGYYVVNSHLRTVPVHPGRSNEENCLAAVEACDLFFGIIRPFYSSGITHQEIRRAVALNKPRWFVVSAHVTFARQVFKQFRCNDDGSLKNPPLAFKKTSVMDDLQVIDMYDDNATVFL